MTSLAPPLDELADLLEASCLNDLTPDQEKRLHELVCGDRECRAHYVLFMHMHAMIERREGHAGSHTAETLDSRPDRRAEAGVPPPTPLLAISAPPIAFAGSYFSSGWPVAYLIATAIFAIGLIVGALVHVSQPAGIVQHPNSSKDSNPQSPINNPLPKASVARITGMVDCEWEGTGGGGQGLRAANQKSEIRNQNSPIRLGDTLALRSGLLEVTYDIGARVILQGPVTYEVESPAGGFLSLGKLTARLEKGSGIQKNANPKRRRGSGGEDDFSGSANQKSEIRNHQSPDLCPLTSDLFAIRTPTALVTDLGTEFGVEVNKSGQTTSQVYRGSVRLQATLPDGTVYGEACILSANQSARVEHRAEQGKTVPVIVVDPPAKPVAFLREIPKRTIKILDLVDVVAGGDGFSGRRNRGIDPTNGHVVYALPLPSDPNTGLLLSDGKYHRVEGSPFVDGVFVPDGAQEEVQVDSAGHSFARFQGTTSKTWTPVWAAGSMQGHDYPTRAWGVDYSSPGHGQILLHANNAITFDLAAIRRANQGAKVVRFLATAGNAGNLASSENDWCADIWVIVDGKSRFQRLQINSVHGAFSVNVPISDKDRFLTLAATDGRNGGVNPLCHDWILFGDPRLELRTVERTAHDVKGGDAISN